MIEVNSSRSVSKEYGVVLQSELSKAYIAARQEEISDAKLLVSFLTCN